MFKSYEVQKMTPNIMLVDTSFMLRRAQYQTATKSLATSTGVPTGGVYSLLQSMLTVLNSFMCSTVIFCFDHGHSKRRLEVYPEYKDRGPVDEDEEEERNEFGMTDYEFFLHQLKLTKAILKSYGIKMIDLPGHEGDDVLYVTAHMLKNCNKIIISEDRDYYALVDNDISCFRPIRNEYVTLDNFELITDYKTPYQFMIAKVLCGDGSDNIPGCMPKVGEGTYQKVIKQFDVDEKITPQKFLEKVAQTKGLRGKDKILLENADQFIKNFDRNLNLIDISLEPFTFFELAGIVRTLKEISKPNYSDIRKLYAYLEFGPAIVDNLNFKFSDMGMFPIINYVNEDYIKEYLK